MHNDNNGFSFSSVGAARPALHCCLCGGHTIALLMDAQTVVMRALESLSVHDTDRKASGIPSAQQAREFLE